MTRAPDPHTDTRRVRGVGRTRRPVVIAGCAAASWLLGLVALNIVTHGGFRTTVLFAIPVCMVAWHRWQAGFAVAAIAILCAWVSDAMPEPGSIAPLWADALMAFAKLSVDALVAFTWGCRTRAKARAKAVPRNRGSIDR